MIKNKEQFGFKGLKVKGITIHNTGNALSAQENYDIMATSKDSRGTHYFVDENEAIKAMPLNWCVYHTGMGIDWACKHTISIEICRSQHSSYLSAEQNAMRTICLLVKILMEIQTYNR